MRPDFVQTASVFTAKVLQILSYFNGFSDDAGMVPQDVALDTYFVKVTLMGVC